MASKHLHSAALLASLTALTACGQTATKPASARTGTGTTVASVMKPGLWRMEGRSAEGALKSTTQCVSPGDTKGEWVTKTFADSDGCRAERNRVSGGVIDVAAVCTSDGGRSTVAIKGAYTATTFESETRMSVATDDGQVLPITMTTKGVRIADTCDSSAGS